MPLSKEKIIEEIKRVAETNGGVAPGKRLFEQEAGIRASEWEGRYWTKWSDALIDSGLPPNRFGILAYDEDVVLARIAAFTRELGHVPNRNEIRLRKRSDPELPNDVTLRNKFRSKGGLIERLLQFAKANSAWSDLIEQLEVESRAIRAVESVDSEDCSPKIGYVYLMQHGNRREFKIGFTFNVIRREGEIAIQLPERVAPVHYIETDDPSGVEAYWHRRFSDRRKNGEWFELSVSEVKAFKRWKKIY